MRHGFPNFLGALLVPLLLAGCAYGPLPQTGPAAQCPPAAARALDAGELLHYHACLATLPTPELALEYAGVKRELARSASAPQRIRLALLLSRPDTPFRSLPQALQLLSPAPGERMPDSLRDLAALLRTALAEQQRLEDKAQGLDKALAAEQAHADSLQDKIDSIKDLERNMTRRETP